MKLIIQIPCLNEEATLERVIESIPRKFDGISEVELVVIDDGSVDRTAELARNFGATLVSHRSTRGLAEAFRSGADYALTHNADIVVNTDGDNQYPQSEIGRLIEPIIQGRADLVIGDRQTQKISHFSTAKKFLQKWGSRVVNLAAGTEIPDAASGFRAYSRLALIKLNLVTKFSYTMETIIQAGYKRLAIESIQITTNPKTRESRLFKSTGEHVVKSGLSIVRSFLMYRPYVIFGWLGLALGIGGMFPFSRYLVLYLMGIQGAQIQSLLVGVSLLTASLLSLALGVIADLIRVNRQLIEDGLSLQKAQQSAQSLAESR